MIVKVHFLIGGSTPVREGVVFEVGVAGVNLSDRRTNCETALYSNDFSQFFSPLHHGV